MLWVQGDRFCVRGARRARGAAVLVLFATAACELRGSPEDLETCSEAPPKGDDLCCEEAVYAPVGLAELVKSPVTYVNQRVQTMGVADWLTGPEDESDCTCAGDLCACVTPLAMRSFVCPAAVRLGGTYRGRPVECSSSGCYPLQPLSVYAACGTWQWDAQENLQGQGTLVLETFCER